MRREERRGGRKEINLCELKSASSTGSLFEKGEGRDEIGKRGVGGTNEI